MLRWIIKSKSFLLWLLLTAAIGGYCYYLFFEAEDKTALLPGRTTDGHHQIEMECSACHTNEKKKNVFTSSGVPSSACMSCHGEALEKFSDSHPIRKFKNPENIIFTEHIDALNCITCHSEHNQKITGEMAVTVPADYCAHCHEVTLENLDSHKDLAYDTCHTAGCHNYHDNTPLAPSYLLKHYGEPKMLEDAILPPLASDAACSDPWSSPETCASCHDQETHDFKQGKHGMRTAFKNLSAMRPELARIPMKSAAAHMAMDCTACHQPDKPKSFAAYNSCIQCHDDPHTKNYTNSKHFLLWSGSGGTTGASCATCHMPRIESDNGGYRVSHDNTANLRPNEKMIRSSCSHCHGLQFSMDALADPALIEANFTGNPSAKHPGIEWTADASIARGNEDTKAIRDYLIKLSNEKKNNQEKR
ncbi:MAG: cytochrome c3 family protein [Akkermansiaceae bacterium]